MIAFVLEVQSPSLISVWDIWTNCLVREVLGFSPLKTLLEEVLPVPGSLPSPED